MIKDIKELENRWASEIADYEYVGELALTKDEYEHYSSLSCNKCIIQRSDSPSLYWSPYKTVLVVLAVNCAYFEYDDDGFWVHFLSRIGLVDRNDLQKTIGSIIEDYLFAKQFLDKKREGPFRYVGAILEQCGVTRRYLPRFAEFLKSSADKYSWEGLIIISKTSYEQVLPEEGMSNYLRKFLADTAGWEFVKTVVRSIVRSRLHSYPLQFLESLKGFRPSFWKELLDRLEANILKPPPASRIINIPPLPKFIYQPRLSRLAILFDDSNVRFGNYMLEGKKVSHSPVELESKSDFKTVYSMQFKSNDSDWKPTELKGWSPEERPYAFFDAENGEVLHTQKYLSEAEYYLVISTEYLAGLQGKHKEQIDKIIKADFGWLSFPFGMFIGFLITIEPATDLKFLGFDVDKKERRHLSWDDNAKRLVGAEDLFDVFVGQLPDLVVIQPELFYDNQLILMGDFGDGPKPIEIPVDSNKIKLDCTVPLKGEIWIEPLGRYRKFSEGNVNQRLSFCCVPDCKIVWPDGLHALDEEPVVKIKGDKSISVSFEGECVAIDSDHRHWRIPQRQTFVEGTLTTEGNISIRLARMIHRASLQDEHMSLLHSLTLEEFVNRENFILTGYPKGQAKLFIRECGKNRALADFGRFNETGKLQFNISALRDTLRRRQFVTGQIGVEHYGKNVLTETRILNTQEIINRLIKLDDDFRWGDELAPEQKKALQELRKCINQRLDKSSLSVCDCLPEQLSNWGKEILYCASFFDGTKLEDLGQDPFPQDVYRTQTFQWLQMARSVSNAEKGSLSVSVDTLLADLKAIIWRPPIKKWKNEFEKICTNLKADSELTELLLEWKNEVVEKNYYVEYKSRIGQMVAGKELTNAWKYYMNNDFRAYHKAKIAIANASPPVADLALILINILHLKNNTPEQVEDIAGRHHRKLLPYVERSILLCKKASSKIFKITTKLSDGVDINVLPLNHEDVALFLR